MMNLQNLHSVKYIITIYMINKRSITFWLNFGDEQLNTTTKYTFNYQLPISKVTLKFNKYKFQIFKTYRTILVNKFQS